MYMTNLSFNKKKCTIYIIHHHCKMVFFLQNYVLPLLIAPRSNKGTQKHDEIFQNDVHCTDVDTERTVQTGSSQADMKFVANDFFARNGQVGFGRGASEQNINSCLKWSKRVQMSPKGSQMVKNT